MKTKMCFGLALAGSLAACSVRAAGTLIATATLTETGKSGANYEYLLTLDNTGSNPINAFWYGWIVGYFDLPSVPTSINAPPGWGATPVSDSVEFANNSGSAIAPGHSGSFTFESTFGPAAMTSGTTGGTATGNSVAYATVIAMLSCDQSDPGIASNPFVPTLSTLPVLDLQPPAVADGNIQLAWSSLPGVAYQVQYATTLGQTNWINLGSVISATNTTTTTNAVIASDSQRFYRVVVSH